MAEDISGKQDAVNMTFELNFFSSWGDIKSDLIKHFNIPTTKYLRILIKSHIDKNTEGGITAMGVIKYNSSEFVILKWRKNLVGYCQSVAQDAEFGENVHIGLFSIMGINFFSKIEKIELFFSVTNDFIMPDDRNINFSSTRHATLLSQINTHLLPDEKREGYLESLCKYVFSYLWPH
jgi:hypothetical protein